MRRIGAVVMVLLVTVSLGVGVGAASDSNDAVAFGSDATVAGAMGDVDCEYPLAVTDATGEEVTVEDEPDEVVVLAPSATQTLWAIGAEERVTGVPIVPYTEGLDGIEDRENVVMEDHFTVDQEVVVDLDPDLVLAPNVIPDEDVESLRDAGLTVHKTTPEVSTHDVKANVALKGALVGECEGADETVEWMDERIAEIESDGPDGDDRPTVYVAMGGGFTAGEGSFTAHLIETAGGDNLGSEAGVEFYDEISQEEIVDHDPDVIVHTEDVPLEEQPEYEALSGTTAMEHEQVVAVDGNEFSQPAPGIVHALETLSAGFQDVETADPVDDETPTPEANEDDEPVDADTTADDDADTTADDTEEAAADGEDVPGLGVATAAFALVVTALLAATVRRR